MINQEKIQKIHYMDIGRYGATSYQQHTSFPYFILISSNPSGQERLETVERNAWGDDKIVDGSIDEFIIENENQKNEITKVIRNTLLNPHGFYWSNHPSRHKVFYEPGDFVSLSNGELLYRLRIEISRDPRGKSPCSSLYRKIKEMELKQTIEHRV